MKIQEYFGNFLKYQNLLRQLVSRDLKKKYRRSILGYIWSVLNPLLTMTVMVLVFSNLFNRNVNNYPIYVLTGQLMFNMMSEATRSALTSITSNGALIQKVYIPKYILVASKATSALVNQLFSFIALIIVMIATKYIPPKTIIFVFIPIFYQFVFSLGFGLILATLTVFFRDMIHIYSVFIVLWTYTTPIFYTIDTISPKAATLIETVNPMYHYVTYLRTLVLEGRLPNLQENLICMGFATIFLITGLIIFYKYQDKFVLYV